MGEEALPLSRMVRRTGCLSFTAALGREGCASVPHLGSEVDLVWVMWRWEKQPEGVGEPAPPLARAVLENWC